MRPCLQGHCRSVAVATDYMKIVSDQIRPFIGDRRFIALGTDVFVRSDTRGSLRTFCEVDRHFVVRAALEALADEGKLPRARISEVIRRYGIDVGKVDPAAVFVTSLSRPLR